MIFIYVIIIMLVKRKDGIKMLDTSKYFDGQEGKELNQVVTRYAELETIIKDNADKMKEIVTEFEALKKQIKNVSADGLNETSKISWYIKKVKDSLYITASEVQTQAPEIYQQLSGMGLVNVRNGARTIESITIK